jgi:superfamily II DNA or RNA helicase
VYIDEVHHLPAMMFYTVSGMFRARYVTGLSGTVYRKDGANLMIEAGAGPIVATVTTDDLIRAERLARPHCYFRSIQAETSVSNAPRHAIINKYVVNFKPRNEDIAAQAIEWASKGNSVLINVEWTKHGKILQSMIDGSHLLHGKDDQHTRLKVINMLREKKIHILISTLMREGVDAPSLNVTINAAGGTDPTQLIGRVLRRSEGKTEAVYIDYIDNQHKQLQRGSMARLKRCKQHKEFVIEQTA